MMLMANNRMSYLYTIYSRVCGWLFGRNIVVVKAKTTAFEIEIFLKDDATIPVINERPLWIIADGRPGLLEAWQDIETYTCYQIPSHVDTIPILFKPRKTHQWVSRMLPATIRKLAENKQCPSQDGLPIERSTPRDSEDEDVQVD